MPCNRIKSFPMDNALLYSVLSGVDRVRMYTMTVVDTL